MMDIQVQIKSWSSRKKTRSRDCAIICMVWLVLEALDEITDGAYVCGKDMRELKMEPERP